MYITSTLQACVLSNDATADAHFLHLSQLFQVQLTNRFSETQQGVGAVLMPNAVTKQAK